MVSRQKSKVGVIATHSFQWDKHKLIELISTWTFLYQTYRRVLVRKYLQSFNLCYLLSYHNHIMSSGESAKWPYGIAFETLDWSYDFWYWLVFTYDVFLNKFR